MIITVGKIISILTQIAFWGSTLFVLYRIFREKGENQSFSTATKTPYIKLILFALAVRLLFLVIGYFLLCIKHDGLIPLKDLFYAFKQSDSNSYLKIAEHGYTFTEDGKHLFLVFFPLYPYIIGFLNAWSYLTTAYLVSFASYAIGICYLYKLVSIDYSERTAWWAVILISIFPLSFFFGVPMSESMMFLTSTMTLYYIRTHKWLRAGVAGALAAFTRMVGITLILAAVVEFIVYYRLIEKLEKGKWLDALKLILKKGLWLLLMLAGTVAYLYINWKTTGDPFKFLYYQRTHWSNTPQYFGKTIASQFELLKNFNGTPVKLYTFIPNIASFVIAISLIVYASLKRLNLSYITYVLAYIAISFSPSWLLSGGRYTTACVPLFIFLACYVERKTYRQIYVATGFIILLIPLLYKFITGGPVY